jgi:hypothetical protein
MTWEPNRADRACDPHDGKVAGEEAMELGTESSRSAGRIARTMGKFSTSAGRIASARAGTMANDFGRWLASAECYLCRAKFQG